MKNLRVYACIITFLLVGLAVLYSCSSNENKDDDLNSLTATTIIKDLKKYNESLPDSKADTRAISRFNWACIALSDACGAYSGAKAGGMIGSLFGPGGTGVGVAIGGIIGSAGASYKAYKMAKLMDGINLYGLDPIPDPDFDPGYDNITSRLVITKAQIKKEDYELGILIGLDSAAVEVGIQHNYMLDLLNSGNNEEYESTIDSLPQTERSIVTSPKFEEEYNSILDNCMSLEVDQSTTCGVIMQLFINAINRENITSEMINEIIIMYSNKVRMSFDLTKDEKKQLLTSFGVLRYSYNYWTEEYKEDNN